MPAGMELAGKLEQFAFCCFVPSTSLVIAWNGQHGFSVFNWLTACEIGQWNEAERPSTEEALEIVERNIDSADYLRHVDFGQF